MMRDERVFYKEVEKGIFQEIKFDELKDGDRFIIIDYPRGSGHEDGNRLFLMKGTPYKNEQSIGTVNVDLIGMIDKIEIRN